jgi:MFS transporter, DHA2 family, multidrug resistance protein
MDTTAQNGVRAGRREYIGLAVLGLPTILVALDMSVLYLALPHLASDLGASSVQQLWITDIYGFILAGLLVTMGNIGDRIGRKRLLLIGAACFAAASVLAAYSTSPEMLIAARALLGIAGSTIMPSTMALLSVLFTQPKQHAAAIGVWMGCFMGGTALGPVIGGLLLETFWWGAAFLLGVPIMVVLLIVGPKLLPEFRNPDAGRIDLPSVAMSLLAILPIVYGLKQLARDGLTATNIIAILAGLIIGVVFVMRQRGLPNPLLDLQLFGNRTFTSALVLTTFAGLIAANQLFSSLYMQSAQHLSPLATALWLLPAAVGMVIVIQLAPIMIRRIRPAYVIAGGLVFAAAGYLMLVPLDGDGNLPLLVTGLVIANLGIGPMAGLCGALAMQSAPPERAGSAAAMVPTFGEFGIAMGVASVGVVGTALYRANVDVDPNLPPDVVASASESTAGALSVAPTLPGPEATNLLNSAYEATAASLSGSAATCAGLVLLAAVMVLFGLRSLPASGDAAPPPAAPADDADTAITPEEAGPAKAV